MGRKRTLEPVEEAAAQEKPKRRAVTRGTTQKHSEIQPQEAAAPASKPKRAHPRALRQEAPKLKEAQSQQHTDEDEDEAPSQSSSSSDSEVEEEEEDEEEEEAVLAEQHKSRRRLRSSRENASTRSRAAPHARRQHTSEEEDEEEDVEDENISEPEEEGNEYDVESQYDRIFKKTRKSNNSTTTVRWGPLIPCATTAPSSGELGALVKFKAEFLTAEQAARAADRALIAMWGREAAEEHLNFPLDEYPADAQRLFGRNLSDYLLAICKQGKDIIARDRVKRNKWKLKLLMNESRGVNVRELNRTLKKMRKAPGFVDITESCGVCPSCRQPWLLGRCTRVTLGRRVGYQPHRAAMLAQGGPKLAAWNKAAVDLKKVNKEAATRLRELIAQEKEKAAAQEQDGSELTSGSSEISSEDHSIDTDSEEDLDVDSEEAIKPRKKSGRAPRDESLLTRKRSEHIGVWQWRPEGLMQADTRTAPKDIEWFLKPTGPSNLARKQEHKEAVAKEKKRAETQSAASEAARAAELAAALAAAEPPGLSVAPYPEDVYHRGPYRDLLKEASRNATSGADMALVEEDDQKWNAPMTEFDSKACTLCQGLHTSRHQLNCPMIIAAYAKPVSGSVEAERKGLPKHVWVPSAVPAPWAAHMRPATLELMAAVQGVANAAVVDYDRLDLAEKLHPDALLAMGLLAEEVVKAELAARQ